MNVAAMAMKLSLVFAQRRSKRLSLPVACLMRARLRLECFAEGLGHAFVVDRQGLMGTPFAFSQSPGSPCCHVGADGQ